MNCRRHTHGQEPIDSLEAVVGDYISKYRDGASRELRFYTIQRSLSDAIKIASLCVLPGGKRHDHQRRIPGKSLIEANLRLQRKLQAISQCHTFAELHQLVDAEINPIYKIGKLTVYDVAHRIGAKLGLAPEFVFFHAGTEEGAHNLGLTGLKDVLPISAFPRIFNRLRAAEIEDCLCIFKDRIKNLLQRGSKPYGRDKYRPI